MKYLLVGVVVITIFCGLVYVSIQQVLRIGANDPQIQISQDFAAKLSQNQSTQDLIPQEKVDISKSLAPFVIVYDKNGNPLSSSALLDGKTPLLPSGVFDYVKQKGEDRLTWQPKDGVRIAAVITGYNGKSVGFVLAGRSLREIEKREDNILHYAGIAWILSVIVISLPFFILKQK